MITTD